MADDGLEWATSENFFNTKANRKMIFQGNGTQLTNIGNTYGGQQTYCLVDGGSFLVDKIYMRDAADSSWVKRNAPLENPEESTTPVTDTAETAVSNQKAYVFFTLPTTDKFYMITGIEWKNGTTVNANVICGVDLVNANPPTDDHTTMVALSSEVAASGASSIQRNSQIVSDLIPGGTLLGVWMLSSTATGNYRYATKASQNMRKSPFNYTNTPPTAESNAWGEHTFELYFKVYYVGYS